MKHTLGPWAAEFDGDDISDSPWGIKDGAGFWVASVLDSASQPHGSKSEANARLIAAAPELLEALRSLLSETDDYPEVMPQTLLNARAAIAKAEGA